MQKALVFICLLSIFFQHSLLMAEEKGGSEVVKNIFVNYHFSFPIKKVVTETKFYEVIENGKLIKNGESETEVINKWGLTMAIVVIPVILLIFFPLSILIKKCDILRKSKLFLIFYMATLFLMDILWLESIEIIVLYPIAVALLFFIVSNNFLHSFAVFLYLFCFLMALLSPVNLTGDSFGKDYWEMMVHSRIYLPPLSIFLGIFVKHFFLIKGKISSA